MIPKQVWQHNDRPILAPLTRPSAEICHTRKPQAPPSLTLHIPLLTPNPATSPLCQENDKQAELQGA